MSRSGRSSGGTESRYPMEERFLAQVHVSSNRFEDWKAIAHKDIEGVLRNAKSWYYRSGELKKSFKPMYEKDAIRGLVRALEGSNRKDMLCLAHLDLTLDDAAYGLHAVTTHDQRSLLAHLHGDQFLDGGILRVHEGQTVDDRFHFVGLKWIAFTSPAPTIEKPRDSVYFEYTATTEDGNGRKVLVQYKRSFPLQKGELQERNHGFVRSPVYQIAIMRIEAGGLLYQALGTYEPVGDEPTWVSQRAMTETFDSISRFHGLADARAITSLGMLRNSAAVRGGGENKACVGCKKKFGVMRARQSCRSCTMCMCKNCVTTLTFFNEESQFSSAARTVSERFCHVCVKSARERRAVEQVSSRLLKVTLDNHEKALDPRRNTDSVSTAQTAPSTISIDSTRAKVERQLSEVSSSVSSDYEVGSHSLSSFHGSESGVAPSPSAYHPGPRHPAQNEVIFEKMNSSIQHQQELLMTIQQERARMARQQQYGMVPMAPPAYYPTMPQAMIPPPSPELGTPATPTSLADADRFEVLS